MTNPFDWSYLTQVPRSWSAYGPFAIAYLVVFATGLIASIGLGRWIERRFRDHALHRRLAARARQIASWLFGVGFTFFVLRALELPFVGMRLWLYLSVLALVVGLGLAVWYWRVVYPAELANFTADQARQRYLRPPSGQRRAAPAPRTRRR